MYILFLVECGTLELPSGFKKECKAPVEEEDVKEVMMETGDDEAYVQRTKNIIQMDIYEEAQQETGDRFPTAIAETATDVSSCLVTGKL